MTADIVDWAGVGQRLRRIRNASGLSQREFGQKFGISQNMISLYEMGRSHGSVVFYAAVAHFGNKSIGWLLDGTENRTTETLHEMIDLHEKMDSSLTTVRHLFTRETIATLDEKLIPENDSRVVREILLKERGVPPSLKRLARDHELWRELAMNGRRVCAILALVRLFGEMGLRHIQGFLNLVGQLERAPQPELVEADPADDDHHG